MAVRILVADSSRTMCVFLEFALRAVGDVEVETALDRRACLDALTAQAPDLLLLDSRLPGASDVALESAVRERAVGGLPVILLAGSSATIEHDRKALGVNDVLHKPLAVEKLHDALGRLLDVSPPPAAPGAERRQSRRLRLPVTVRVSGQTGVAATTDDISPFGAFFRTDQPHRVGDRFQASLEFPHLDRSIEVSCQVRHMRNGGVGIRFDHSTHEVARQLVAAFISPL